MGEGRERWMGVVVRIKIQNWDLAWGQASCVTLPTTRARPFLSQPASRPTHFNSRKTLHTDPVVLPGVGKAISALNCFGRRVPMSIIRPSGNIKWTPEKSNHSSLDVVRNQFDDFSRCANSDWRGVLLWWTCPVVGPEPSPVASPPHHSASSALSTCFV